MLTISKQVVKITISHNWIASHYRFLLKKNFHLKVINISSTFKFLKKVGFCEVEAMCTIQLFSVALTMNNEKYEKR